MIVKNYCKKNLNKKGDIMEPILQVSNLSKYYDKFKLEDINFEILPGTIMGLIGRNGAGKTTTLKAVLNLIHTSSGTINYFGMDLSDNEDQIKQRIGYAGGAIDYYKKKKIKKIMEITRSFYDHWDDDKYRKYMDLFSIDEDKTPSELSEGMKVKLNLVIALSHGAKLLILDEPTSGLDPVSREELLEVFKYLKTQGVAILFSTHITSDLDKCADHITYIRDGHLHYSGDMSQYIDYCRRNGIGSNLEEIMIYYEREAFNEKLAK